MTAPLPLKIKIQIYRGDEIAMGPGKADLLDAIARTGSISAAARDLGMSYRRGWMLVDVMNRCWREPLVEASAGGSRGGGARITESGRRILTLYRGLQSSMETASHGPECDALSALLRPDNSEN
ncbi:MAG: winged helix-turn-helix domain-containing protein [Sphingobium sp.]